MAHSMAPEIVSTLVVFGLLATGYPIIMRVLARIVHSKRMRLAELGNILSRDECLSREWKEIISWMLENSFSPWPMAKVAANIPSYLLAALRGKAKILVPITDDRIRKIVEEFTDLHIASVAAANPFFAVVASFELAIIAFVFFPIGKSAVATRIRLSALVGAERPNHPHYQH